MPEKVSGSERQYLRKYLAKVSGSYQVSDWRAGKMEISGLAIRELKEKLADQRLGT